jgi:hypothetical protein
MESNCKNVIVEIIREIRDKASYLKQVDIADPKYNADFYEGMAQAYTFILNGVVDYINASDGINLDDVGLADFEPNEVMNYLDRDSRNSI